jgi:hypothetical protein
MLLCLPMMAHLQGLPHAPELTQRLRAAQIICVAMVMGSIAFLIVALVIPERPKPPIGAYPVISYMGVAGAAIQILLRFIVPSLSASSYLKQLSPGSKDFDAQLFTIFQTRMVVGLALLEGGSFFNLVAYLIECQWWSLVVVGVLVFLMMSMFPTLGQFESWAEATKRDLQNQF